MISEQTRGGFDKTCTNQFVVLGGELGEPLVKLQHCYYSHQIPEEEHTGRKEKVIAATTDFIFQLHFRLAVTSASCITFSIQNKSCHTYKTSHIFKFSATWPHLCATFFFLSLHSCSHYVSVLWLYFYLYYFKRSPVLQMAEVLQVEISGVLCQIDGVHILERKQTCLLSKKNPKHICWRLMSQAMQANK